MNFISNFPVCGFVKGNLLWLMMPQERQKIEEEAQSETSQSGEAFSEELHTQSQIGSNSQVLWKARQSQFALAPNIPYLTNKEEYVSGYCQ